MSEETINTKKEIKFIDYVTFVSPFLIFLGMARLITFYKAFGVSIVSYLDFSEVITSFFDILFIVVVFLAYTLIQNFLFGSKYQTEKADKNRSEILSQENLRKLFPLYIKYFAALLIFQFVVIAGCLISHFIFNATSLWTIFLITTIFIFLIAFLIINVEIERKHIHFNSNINKKRFIFFTLYFLVFTLGVTFYSSYQVHEIKIEKSTYGVTILLDNEKTLISDSSNYFIGKTQNYLFFYHEQLRNTDIIPMTRVTQITMVDRQELNKIR